MAEVIASVVLCPWEVTKIFVVTNPQFTGSLLNAMRHIIAVEGLIGLYKGIQFVMLRQVPYTCAKLVGYDIILSKLKAFVSGRRKLSDDSFVQAFSAILAG